MDARRRFQDQIDQKVDACMQRALGSQMSCTINQEGRQVKRGEEGRQNTHPLSVNGKQRKKDEWQLCVVR
jgi:hypothetical protein